VARNRGLFVIEDAAQSFGAEYHGAKACSLADIAANLLFPAKPLGCYGDGGMVFTNDDELASRLDSIRVHGKGSDKYDNVRIASTGAATPSRPLSSWPSSSSSPKRSS
jgi:dTDP-4-amino-4,6-dideoxygalactose transaminase